MTSQPGIMQDLNASKAPALAFVVIGMIWGSFAGLVPDLKAAIGATDGEFGIAMFIAALGAIAAMWLAPRIDAALHARALQVGSITIALFGLLPGLSTGVWAFAGAMLLISAASGTLDVIMNTRVSKIEADLGRPLMNLNHGVFSIAYAIAALSTGLFRQAGFGPVVVFGVIALIIVALVPYMRSAPADVEDTATPTKGGQFSLIFFGGMIIMIAFLAEQATEAWSALLLERELGGEPAHGALGPAILGLTMGFGRLSGQIALGRFAETRVIQVAALVAATGLFIAVQADGLLLAYAGFAILGLGVSVTAPMAYSAVGKRVSEAYRSIVITRMSVLGYMGFFIGPPMMGFLSEAFGLRVSFLSVAGVLLMIVVIFAPGLRRLPADIVAKS